MDVMTENKAVPQLRFGEFEDDWNNHLLDDIAIFLKGKGISKSELDDDGKTECIRYGELYVYYNELIDEVKSKTNLKNIVLSKANDVIIPASGETQLDIATASCVLRSGIALGGDLNIIRTDNNGVFLSYYLNSKKKFEIARLSQGSSVVHLYASQLKTLKLNLPSRPEQQKIASFLSAVDKKLQQLTKKKELLEEYKKGVMQKIFSQELRFKDDNGNNYPHWEEKTIEDLFIVTRGTVLAIPKISPYKNDECPYPVYSSQTKNNGIAGYYKDYLFEDAITWTTDGAQAGEVNLRKGKFYCTNVCGVLKSDEGYANLCITEKLNRVSRRYVSYVGNPKLMNNVMAKIKISIPSSLDEQKKIANFLSLLDSKIELVSNQIENTKAFKKGLLQQMFV